MQPSLHIQNIFDALNPNGTGVDGHPKSRCLQLQNRAVALAKTGDIVAVGDDCPSSYVDYMLRTVGASDVVVLRYGVSQDPREHISARSVFQALARERKLEEALHRQPTLSPYMKSAALYRNARAAGVTIPQSEWQTVIDDHITETMNDKGEFYRECVDAEIAVPTYWTIERHNLTECVPDLLETHQRPLYVRQTRSGGTLGNFTARRDGAIYSIPELGHRLLSYRDFLQILTMLSKASLSKEYVISELLDLVGSPGTLFYCTDSGVKVISHTLQVMNENRVFLGFTYPVEDERLRKHTISVEESVLKLIDPWRQRGFRGYGNIDWMVTKDDQCLLAERNARQTGVVAPLRVEASCSGLHTNDCLVAPPTRSIITRDVVKLRQGTSFDDVHAELREKGLLCGPLPTDEGAIVTIPPSPTIGINTVGIMVIARRLSTAYQIYSQVRDALGAEEDRLLFELKD